MERFDAAMTYLGSFTDYEQKQPEALLRRVLDLERMIRVSRAFDDPQHAFRSLHVTGTKGKGSVTLLLDVLLRAHGRHVGRFLSPHLEHITERIAIDGRDIDRETFADRLDELRPYIESKRIVDAEAVPTFFETMTLMAFLEFKRTRVDFAVVEVGLGGRLDATNVVVPEVAILTNVDLEHTRVLGTTLESIAREKAGIIKSGRPVVTGIPRASAAGEVIAAIAAERRSPVSWLGDDIVVACAPMHESDVSRSIDVRVGERRFENMVLGVTGRHQAENAALAIAALVELERRGGFVIDEAAVRSALACVRLPARLEAIALAPLPGRPRRALLLDSAHTKGSILRLAEHIREVYPSGRRTLVIGLLRDKDPDYVLSDLAGLFDRVLLVTPASPRAASAIELAPIVSRILSPARVEVSPAIPGVAELDALDSDLVVVAGSTYLAGVVRSAFAAAGRVAAGAVIAS